MYLGAVFRARPTAFLIALAGAWALLAASASAAKPLNYVGMGDSYSAASGVQPPDPEASPDCLRSSRNYPHLIAAEIGAALTDVTCGAADTDDFFEPQYDDVPPQLDALSNRTRLVTLTIGGNDSSVFINTITSCGTAGLSTGGMGSPCKDQYGSSFADTIREKTFPALVKTLKAIHHRAKRARVAILGYPWIMPETKGCFTQMPVAEGDVPYVHHIQWVLNHSVRKAARRTGTRYINFNRASEGHDACKPIGVRWVEPVIGTTNPVVVHPNALGEAEMADRVIRKLRLG